MFVISAPSGTGKSTIIELVMKQLPELKKPVSYTTRQKRNGEKDGVDYNFISSDEFKNKISNGDLIEWATVYNNFYGTSMEYLSKELAKGAFLIKDIDTQGVLQLKGKLKDRAILIFIEPRSLTELEKRIRDRGKDDNATIEKRMSCARSEMAQAPKYDHRIVNKDLNSAVRALKDIISGYIK